MKLYQLVTSIINIAFFLSHKLSGIVCYTAYANVQLSI